MMNTQYIKVCLLYLTSYYCSMLFCVQHYPDFHPEESHGIEA